MLIMITNSIAPYCYDIAHILGLPAKMSHRFRYRSKWIGLSRDINTIKGEYAVIVLRNFETGNFIPVRYVYIEDVEIFGDINYIEFRMDNYFPTDHIEATSQTVKKYIEKMGLENEGGKHLKKLFFDINEDFIYQIRQEGAGEEHEKWGMILKEIGNLQCYEDFSFLKIYSTRDSNGKQACITKDDTGKYSFLLKPGLVYWLDVIQQIPWEIEEKETIETPYDVELKTETDEIIVLRKIQRVVGKYDLLKFIFKTPSGFKTKHTYLELGNKQRGITSKFGLPALFLPLKIQPPQWMKVMKICQLVLVILAIIVIVASEPIGRIFSIGPDWIRTFALLVLVGASGKWDDYITSLFKTVS